jgi:hydrogenase maturation protease
MTLIDSTLVGETGAMPRPPSIDARVLVLGVGNILMGDEGVGVHTLRRLEEQSELPGVRLLDGGTGGVNLLGEFDRVAAIILIDATRDGRPAGTVTYLRPERAGDLPRGLGAHDFGLKDLFTASALIGRMPRLHLYTISVTTIRPMCTELSAEVTTAVSTVVNRVREHAARLVAEVRKNDNPCGDLDSRCADAGRTL